MSTPTVFPKPAYPTLIARALRLKCPRCGQGRMFAGIFQMRPECGACGLRFEREPGYFLGSIYVNYGLTALLTTVGYLILRLRYNVPGGILLGFFVVFCGVFPAFFFRYARALWLAMDCQIDPTAMVGTGVTDEVRARNEAAKANRPAKLPGESDPSGI